MTAHDAVGVLTGTTAERCTQARSLVLDGQVGAATTLLRDLLRTDPEPTLQWLTDQVVEGLAAEDLTYLGDLARLNALLRHGPDPAVPDERVLSVGKLRHDADQLRYLQHIGVLDGAADALVDSYQVVADELAAEGEETRRPLGDDQTPLAAGYGRLTHLRDTPRVSQALSASWDRAGVEDRYLDARPGLVVIDDFLSPEALAGLQQFCLESTLWNGNRYPYGRLGSFVDSGFCCPLVLQVAEEIREAFPRVIGQRHPLRQLWGFKYPPELPAASTIHADFAAVNVNFWITPTTANRNPDTGGLVVYDTDAPPDWDFRTYNERLDLIKDFLARRRAEQIYVPYRENRAIIFNSDLFHATAEVDFGTAYEDRRVNVTMLYGVRELDDLHPGLSGSSTTSAALTSAALRSSGRSAAFSRSRRR